MKNEFEVFCDRAANAASVAAAGLARDSSKSLSAAYRSAVRFVMGSIAALMLETRDVPHAEDTCRALRHLAANEKTCRSASDLISTFGKSTGVDLLTSSGSINLPLEHERAVLRSILASDEGIPLTSVYFDSVPPEWIGRLYEQLLSLRPMYEADSQKIVLQSDLRGRKKSGSFFTPPYIIDHIVTNALGRLENPSAARIMDPSMGPGEFLIRTLRSLSRRLSVKDAAEKCIFGCDIDPAAVDIARFLVWLETGGQADARTIAEHLVCADALVLNWEDAFPDVFSSEPGFDAAIGNPPYVAAKNGMSVGSRSGRGQSDYYLLFLEGIIRNRLVRPGGTLAMVLPDPFLIRANAAHVRRELLGKWTIESVVHIEGAFPSANVANIVLDCTNRPPLSDMFPVVRLDKSHLRQQFVLRPAVTVSKLSKYVKHSFALAQPRAEVLYLVDDDHWKQAFSAIHGLEMSLSAIKPPFVYLKDIGVETTFRGEEIGKRAIISSKGDLPILLGGQSLEPYRVNWEGHRISWDAVNKCMDWYRGEKIVLQKSSAKLIAAFDSKGYIIPQSVYGIKLNPGGYHPLYLLALLNSTFLNGYVFRAFTGYKLVQPQLELEDIRKLPIRSINFYSTPSERAKLADEGRKVFEAELSNGHGDFTKLGGLIKKWDKSGREDSAHDLLVYLAGLATKAAAGERVESLLSSRIHRAIDTVVESLYGVT
ncbi:MAG: N-6 DNA methylase [Armatimonadota bacterium]